MSNPEKAEVQMPERIPSKWFGDSTNGIEFRPLDESGVLDEVLLYIDGKCVFHLESMHDRYYWMGLYGKTHEAHVHVSSRNGRSYVDATGDGWKAMPANDPTTQLIDGAKGRGI